MEVWARLEEQKPDYGFINPDGSFNESRLSEIAGNITEGVLYRRYFSDLGSFTEVFQALMDDYRTYKGYVFWTEFLPSVGYKLNRLKYLTPKHTDEHCVIRLADSGHYKCSICGNSFEEFELFAGDPGELQYCPYCNAINGDALR